MSAKAAREYDSALKRALPKGVVGVTNPMELSNVPLNGSGSTKSYEIADKAQKQLFMSTGTPASLFGSETTSSNIVKLTVKKRRLLAIHNNLAYVGVLLQLNISRIQNSRWANLSSELLRQSNFTIEDDIKVLKEAVTMGGSRLDYLASLGSEPLEIYSKLMMEQQILDIDSIMLPKQTSFTMSSSDSSNGAGRPTTSNPTDDTDRINDSN